MGMDFEEFKQEVQDRIKDFLPPAYADAKVSIIKSEKLNESYTALNVGLKGETVLPAVNLNKLFHHYENGAVLDELLSSTAEAVMQKPPAVDVKRLQNYEEVKDRLFIRVSSAERNEDMLKRLPHTMKEDLAVTYHVIVQELEKGIASTPVTYEMLNNYGVSPDQLHADAMASGEKLYPLKADSMSHVMEEMLRQEMSDHGMDEAEISSMIDLFLLPESSIPMIIVSNDQRLNGAAVMFYPEAMEKLSEQLGGSFHILPSSVHEMIIIPESEELNAQELQALVSEVNATQVAPQDRLTDEVYHYDFEDRIFEKASSYEERMAAKQAGRENSEKESRLKSSILKQLDEKKEKAREMASAVVKPEKHRIAEAAI